MFAILALDHKRAAVTQYYLEQYITFHGGPQAPPWTNIIIAKAKLSYSLIYLDFSRHSHVTHVEECISLRTIYFWYEYSFNAATHSLLLSVCIVLFLLFFSLLQGAYQRTQLISQTNI